MVSINTVSNALQAIAASSLMDALNHQSPIVSAADRASAYDLYIQYLEVMVGAANTKGGCKTIDTNGDGLGAPREITICPSEVKEAPKNDGPHFAPTGKQGDW